MVTVFIAPPSFEELERRLVGRTETPEQQAKRLKPRKSSLPLNRIRQSHHQYVVDDAANELWDLIATESICNHNNYKDCNMRSNISGAYFYKKEA